MPGRRIDRRVVQNQAHGSIKIKDNDPSDTSDPEVTKTKKRKAHEKAKKEAKRRRADAKAMALYGPGPEVSDMSEEESTYEEQSEEEAVVSVKKHAATTTEAASSVGKALAESLRLQVTGETGETSILDLKVTLGDVLKNHLPKGFAELYSANRADNITNRIEMNGDIIMGNTLAGGKLIDTNPFSGRDKIKEKDSDQPSFLGISLELRLPIYRMVLRGEHAVDFERRTGFGHSSALLRTCKQIHEEARVILYGENAFHFARSHEHRGKYWEEKWEEIGYRDVRRFLETIGPVNVSHLKYVSFALTDAMATVTHSAIPIWDRRFVNDATLHRVLRLIGANATLRKLAIQLAGRAMVSTTDFHFLKALSEIKCHELVFIRHYRGHLGKLQMGIKERLEEVMVIEFDDKNEIHPALNKKNKVLMVYQDKPRSGNWGSLVSFL